MKRFRFLAVLLLAGLLTISCGDDDGGSSGGSGVADTNPLQQKTNEQAAAAEAATTEAADAQAAAAVPGGRNDFNLSFKQTVQPCASCGISASILVP